MVEYEPYDEETSHDTYMSDPTSKSIKGFIEALNIFSQYADKGEDERFFFGAEHDIIYMCVDTKVLHPNSPAGIRLRELGFHIDDEDWAYFT
jgi:hypothetical protein